VSTITMLWDGIHLETIPRQGDVGCVIENPYFSPGVYHVSVAIQSQISTQLGTKWYMPLTELGSFVVLPGLLRGLLPGAPSAYLVSKIPPMIVEHSWRLNGCTLSKMKSSAHEGG